MTPEFCFPLFMSVLAVYIITVVYGISYHYIPYLIWKMSFCQPRLLAMLNIPVPKKFFPVEKHLNSLALKVGNNFPTHSAKLTKLTNIINPYLKWKFDLAWSNLPEHVTPTVVYHGTRVSNIPSIVRKGLLVPGFKSGIPVANGSAYGVGIYTSTDVSVSLSYVRDGSKVLICAILNDVSGVSNHGSILVVKDSSYVLPCFVAEYTNNQTNVKYSNMLGLAVRSLFRLLFFTITSFIVAHFLSTVLLLLLPQEVPNYDLLRAFNTFGNNTVINIFSLLYFPYLLFYYAYILLCYIFNLLYFCTTMAYGFGIELVDPLKALLTTIYALLGFCLDVILYVFYSAFLVVSYLSSAIYQTVRLIVSVLAKLHEPSQLLKGFLNPSLVS